MCVKFFSHFEFGRSRTVGIGKRSPVSCAKEESMMQSRKKRTNLDEPVKLTETEKNEPGLRKFGFFSALIFAFFCCMVLNSFVWWFHSRRTASSEDDITLLLQKLFGPESQKVAPIT